MPIVNSKYKNPRWENNTTPAIDETELNALSDTVESLDAERGQSPVLKGNVEVQGQGGEPNVLFTESGESGKIIVGTDPTDGSLNLVYDDGNTANNGVSVRGIREPKISGTVFLTDVPNGLGASITVGYGSDNKPYMEILGSDNDEPVEITGVETPSVPTGAANKAYVDGIKAGIKACLEMISTLLASNGWDTAEAATGLQTLNELIDQL